MNKYIYNEFTNKNNTMTFIEFLTEIELNFSFDPSKETPADIVAKSKRAAKMGAVNPERAIKQRTMNIKNKMHDIQTNKDDPFEAERLAIKNLEQKIAKMKLLLARKEKAMQRGQIQGKTPGVV